MSFKINEVIVAIVLSLALVSQAVAYDASLCLIDTDQSTAMEMAHGDMDADSMGDCSMSSCDPSALSSPASQNAGTNCDQACQCPMECSSSVVFGINAISTSESVATEQRSRKLQTAFLSESISTLFRPPIFS